MYIYRDDLSGVYWIPSLQQAAVGPFELRDWRAALQASVFVFTRFLATLNPEPLPPKTLNPKH